MNRRFTILASFVAALVAVSCTEEQPDDPNAGRTAVCFTIEDDSATKAPTPVTALSEFYCSATTGSAGSETRRWANAVFVQQGQENSYKCTGQYWPSSDIGMHFYASNVEMTNDAAGQKISVSSIDTDVVCAYLQTPNYLQVNSLVFKHVFARVSTIAVTGVSQLSDVSVSVSAPTSGTYNLRTGEWTRGTLSDIALNLGDNNIWIVPGTYTFSLSFKDATGTEYTETCDMALNAGYVNSVTFGIGGNVDDIVVDVQSEPVEGAKDEPADDLTKDEEYTASVTVNGGTDVTVSSDEQDLTLVVTASHKKNYYRQSRHFTRTGQHMTYTYLSGRVWETDVWDEWQAGELTAETEAYKHDDITDTPTLSSNKTWLTVVSLTKGHITANGSITNSRTATYTVKNSAKTSVTATAKVTQSKKDRYITGYEIGAISASPSSVGAAGADATISGGDIYEVWSDGTRVKVEGQTATLSIGSNSANSSFSGRMNGRTATIPSLGTTTVAAGKYIVTATYTVSGYTVTPVTCEINQAANAVQSVTVSPTSVTITKGASADVTATATYTSGDTTSANVTWSSANSSVASVNGSGRITGTGVGSTTVTASSGGKSASVSVTVGAPTITGYSNLTLSLGTVSDIPAAGGTSNVPSVTYSYKVSYSDGTSETKTNTGATVYYGKATNPTSTSSGSCQFTASSLGTTIKARTQLGSSFVKVVIGNQSAEKSVAVYQAKNEISSYGKPTVSSFSYSPNPIAVAGGSSNPSVSYSQTVNYSSGSTSSITSGATVSYSGSATGFTLDASSGKVTASSNSGATTTTYSKPTISLSYSPTTIAVGGGSSSATLSYSQTKTVTRAATSERSITVTVTVTMNGKSNTKTATVKQSKDSGNTSTTNLISGGTVSYSGSANGFTVDATSGKVTASSNSGTTTTTYSNPSVTLSYSPNPVAAAGGTTSPTVSYSQTKTVTRSATSARSVTVTATVSMNGQSNTKSATVSQAKDSGNTSTSNITSGGSVSYSMTAATGFTLTSTSTGKINVSANTVASTRSTTATATVTLNSKTGSGTCTVSQKEAIVINFDD